MKLNKHFLWGAGSLLLLTGCIDNNYDLSDIDTTSEFKVKDLVIPVNLATVELRDIIKVEPTDQLHVVTIGDQEFYAVEQTGDINSEGIDIDAVVSKADDMSPSTATFRLDKGNGNAMKRADESNKIYFLIDEVYKDLDYRDDVVDGAVHNITKLNYNPLTFEMDLMITSNINGINSSLEKIQMYIPAGLNVIAVEAPGYTFNSDSYNVEDGSLYIDHINVTNGKAQIKIISNAIDFTVQAYQDLSADKKPFIYNGQDGKGTFQLLSQFTIETGELMFSASPEALASLPDELQFSVTYKVDDLEATSMEGSIQYSLTPDAIESVNLNDLPDFLDDPETNLMLANPQIYLKLQNPVAKYGLGYQAALSITPERDGNTERPIDSPLIKVDKSYTSGDVYFLLAPEPGNNQMTNGIPDDFNPGSNGTIERITYSDLGNILAGNGLPQQLNIDIIDAEIPLTELSSPLEFDSNIEGMEGKYMFLAPLTLKNNSTIVKVVDGWWSEDLADLTIDYLTIGAIATNGLPTGVQLRAFAINQNGEQISTEASLNLNEGATPQEISLVMDGPFNNLDGIKLYVIAKNNDNQLDALSPDQFITLDNLKAKVTGNYTKKF